jgi:hypothetical protein
LTGTLGLLTASVTAATAPASARGLGARDALPSALERLAVPVRLPHCGMPIVEWRSTAELPTETAMSDQALGVVDDACRRACDRYGAFLRFKHLPQRVAEPGPLPDLSLLPANVELDGRSPRALNDLPTRFGAVAPGCCYWGLYVGSLDHLFVRNDPLTKDALGRVEPNPRFIRTLTHELGHVLSDRLGVWKVIPYERALDEDLAEQFVAFMGMNFPAESSSDDLTLHRAGSTDRATASAD